MRILIAIGVNRSREAGAAGVVFNHAEELQKLGHQVETWFFDDLLPKPTWPARFRDLEFAAAVNRHIRTDPEKFDVVNLHAPWGCAYGLSRWLLGSKGLPPYVFTMQGSEERYALAMRLEDKKGRATHFGFRNRLWHRAYHQTLYDISISTADFGNVANREGWILSELKYSHPPGRVWFVPNGVNPQFFQKRDFSDGLTTKLLYVGTWLDRKGIYYLVDAFSALANRIPDLRLTIAGCGVSESEVKLHFSEALRDKIVVIPFLKRDEMPALYASHDIFVFPSLVEGMPLTLLEAMASAMPVVTTNTCGMADLIEDGKNGLLVTPADADALSGAIETLAQSEQRRRELGLNAQSTVQDYSWALVVKKLEHVLNLAVRMKAG